MTRRGWVASFALIGLFIFVLWSSSLIVGEPLHQGNETDQYQTFEALVQTHEAIEADLTLANSLSDALSTAPPYDGTATIVMVDTVYASLSQINATVRAEVGIETGKYTAYFLNLSSDTSIEVSLLKEMLEQQYYWNVSDITPEQLTDPTNSFLHGLDASEPVLIIYGGSQALANTELQAIQAYVSGGGALVVMGGLNTTDDSLSFSETDALSTWLYENFGVGFNRDLVLDQEQAFQSPAIPVSVDLNQNSFITTAHFRGGRTALIFTVPNSIRIAQPTPENVQVTILALSGADAYAKTDLQGVLAGDVTQVADDTVGPFVLAASAEDTHSGSRVILIGSASLADDWFAALSSSGVENLQVMINSIIWAAHFDMDADQLRTQIAETVSPLVLPRFHQTATAWAGG